MSRSAQADRTAVDLIDLSAEDDLELDTPPAKRQRRQQLDDEQLARTLQQREYKHDKARSSSPTDDCAFHVNAIRGVSNQHSLRLREVVVGDIQRCVALNYCWDLAWLLEECPVLQTVQRVDCVAGERYKFAERGSEELRQQADELRLPNVHAHFARLPLPYSCHHTKLLLLFYGHGLRFVHTTANFLNCDVSYKNQSVFVQDFPLRTEAARESWKSEWWLHDDFGRSLCDYFDSYSAIGLDLLPLLRQFDYRAARAILIPSAPGTYTGQQMWRYGHMKVRAVLQRELTATASLASQPIVAQFSSLGSVQSKWLTELRRSLGASAGPLQSSEPPAIRLVWPTLDDVRDSIEGWMAGASLCCDSRNLNATVRPLLHRWDGSVSGRHQAAPHIKSYCRASGQHAAYVIITSANLSAAAWGQLQRNDTQLAVRHYEIGLLFTPSVLQHHYNAPAALRAFSCTEPAGRLTPHWDDTRSSQVQLWLPSLADNHPSAERQQVSASSSSASVLSVRRVLCPLPYNVCPTRYGATDEPWRWDEDQLQPDRRGATFIAVGGRR